MPSANATITATGKPSFSAARKAIDVTAAPQGKVKVDAAAVEAALPTESKAAGRLSPDVEAQVRAIGRGIGDKIVGFAREQGWLNGVAPPPEPEKKKAGV